MSERFFIRFNMHKFAGNPQDSVAVFSASLNVEESKILAHLEEIEALQDARADSLRKKYPEEIKKLQGKKVLFLGDSLTSDRTGYRPAVTKAAGLDAKDGAISGATSAAIFIPARNQIYGGAPEIVSVLLGSNDSVSVEEEQYHMVCPEEFRKNLRRIAFWAKDSGAKLLMMEIPMVAEKQFRESFAASARFNTNRVVAQYNEIVREIAGEFGAKLIPNSWMQQAAEVAELVDADGIHLNRAGHDLLAEQWLKAAAELI